MHRLRSLLALALLVLAPGCKKSVPPPTAPPPPPAAGATARNPSPAPSPPAILEFDGAPRTIERGQSAILRWRVNEATEVSISPGIGPVGNSAKREISPVQTTTYTLTAKGPGGVASSSLMIVVAVAPPPPPAPRPRSGESLVAALQDAYFDYNSSDLRNDARTALVNDAAVLKQLLSESPSAVILIEGHCDERGSAEYNLGLGDRRASVAREFLVELQVPADRVRAISYGKERPQCVDATEECWQRNRRVHFVVGGP